MIYVAPRYVAPPWERVHRTVQVGAEDYVEPERGPLELYLSVFPDRYVRWRRDRQLYEIRQRDVNGESRIEFVFEYDAPPNPITGEAFTEDEMAVLIETGSPIAFKCFRHFDYDFVRERLRQRVEFLERGSRKYNERLADRNRRRWRRRMRAVASEAAARIGENQKYLKYLGPDGRLDPRQRYRPQFTPVGVDLSSKEAQ